MGSQVLPAGTGGKARCLTGAEGHRHSRLRRRYARDYRSNYESDYREQLAAAGLNYHYELIDAQAARIVANPPERALWGVPDNTTGRKLFKLVNELKKHGIPTRKFHVSLSRMSAGGGDQYGSFNLPAQEDGIIKV